MHAIECAGHSSGNCLTLAAVVHELEWHLLQHLKLSKTLRSAFRKHSTLGQQLSGNKAILLLPVLYLIVKVYCPRNTYKLKFISFKHYKVVWYSAFSRSFCLSFLARNNPILYFKDLTFRMFISLSTCDGTLYYKTRGKNMIVSKFLIFVCSTDK